MSTTLAKFLAITKAFSFWILWLLLLQLSGAFEGFFPAQVKSCIYGVIGSLIAFGLTWAYLKSEKSTFSKIGLIWQSRTPLRFIYGSLIGAAIFIAMTLLLLLFGSMHLNFAGASAANIIQTMITLFFLALMEEITFRSYPILKLKDNCGLLAAQLFVAIGFASYHFAIGWNLQTVLMGPFVWAWVYGLAAIRSGGIALPLGLHMMINVGQNLTGMSGNTAAVWKIDFNSADHPNLQLTLFGLHAVVFLIAIGLTYYFSKRKSNLNGLVD